MSVSSDRERMRAKALLELLARLGAIQVPVAQKAVEQIGIMDQSFAQPGAVAEDEDGVVHQRGMLLQKLQQLRRRRLRQPFELIHRSIGIRRGR